MTKIKLDEVSNRKVAITTQLKQLVNSVITPELLEELYLLSTTNQVGITYRDIVQIFTDEVKQTLTNHVVNLKL